MLSTYDRATRRKTAELQNCVDALEVEKLNGVSEISFSLPKNDAKNQHCGQFQFIRWDTGQFYRILNGVETISSDSVDLMSYSGEHVAATLIDDVIFGTLQIDNLTTRQVIERVLSYQTTKNWVLGDCDFTRGFSYSWSNENLLVALFSIPNRFDVDYRWVFDTSNYPWTLHLKVFDQSVNPEYYIRNGRNLLDSSRTSSGQEICTRLYALGYGEGVNQLTFSSVNGGIPYIESPEAIEKYGLITRIWEDSRFEDPQALLDRAKVLLKGYSEPYESYSVNVADLEKLTGEKYDRAEAGKIAWFEGYKTYITQVTRHLQDVGQDMLELANAPEDIASSIADLADRQRINGVYANGATNIYALSFNDNADAQHPAALKFFVPTEARQINKVMLTWELDQYRAYETGAEYGGGSTKATGGGGSSTQTSSSGGGGSETSSSGGGGSTTSGPSSRTTVTSYILSGDQQYMDGGGTLPPSRLTSQDHAHRTEVEVYMDHDHDVSIPTHRHSVSVPSHNHSVKIPEHTHGVDIPSHTHKIVYGIYEGPRASSVTLRVDGNNIPLAPNQNEIDIATSLGVDDSGKIRRGTFHRIEIIPNSLTRITASLSVQLFIQSVGGGDY